MSRDAQTTHRRFFDQSEHNARMWAFACRGPHQWVQVDECISRCMRCGNFGLTALLKQPEAEHE